jgi:hypothetical protein
MPHYYDFGAEREHVGRDLLRPEAWDALRVKTDGPFSVPRTREAFEAAAAERPEVKERAAAVVAVARERGARRLASYGAGTALIELLIHHAAPELELVVTDYTPDAVERVAELFPEAELRRHDLLAEAPVDADLHLFHRVDTEFSNRQWKTVLKRFRAAPVLVAAAEVADLDRFVAEIRARLYSRRNASRAGWLRNRAALDALWRTEHDTKHLEVGDLDGWMLEPRR